MQTATILHSMIVEARRNGYGSELWRVAEEAASRLIFLNEAGEEKSFQWRTNVRVESEQGINITQKIWAAHVAFVEQKIKDEVEHFTSSLTLSTTFGQNGKMSMTMIGRRVKTNGFRVHHLRYFPFRCGRRRRGQNYHQPRQLTRWLQPCQTLLLT